MFESGPSSAADRDSVPKRGHSKWGFLEFPMNDRFFSRCLCGSKSRKGKGSQVAISHSCEIRTRFVTVVGAMSEKGVPATSPPTFCRNLIKMSNCWDVHLCRLLAQATSNARRFKSAALEFGWKNFEDKGGKGKNELGRGEQAVLQSPIPSFRSCALALSRSLW